MKLSELSLTDLYQLKTYIKKQMKQYKMLEEYERLSDTNYLLLDSKLIKIENAIEAFEEKIIY
ncbi:hypothetical protein FNW52_12400 [Flavobacterium sp. ZT3R18]|uniref:hypothetical protein n=1 Tax=Flavobacterium sp. ZT3R18 TaxID=2594429 RepID=UPI00117AD6AC|nr:hypothetical protein [Flavobacterium sp. ZT3R18]TRX34936.1 hypothetical protein FNW52_12400 [Flavobacterium sp. ZT3R18]